MAEHGVPTQEEIANLPRWAIVAFAARCAARVRPLLDRAGELAARAATAVSAAENAHVAAETANSDYAAYMAAANDDTARARSADIAFADAAYAHSAAVASGDASGYSNLVREDFEALARAARGVRQHPAPESVFGAMWPVEAPDWWPDDDASSNPGPRSSD